MRRLKTIEYAFPTFTGMTLNSGNYTGANLPIFIPETSGRVFRSVILETTCHDNEGTVADDLTARRMGISCNFGTNWTDRDITNTLADSAENMSYVWFADVTSEFTNRFGTGASGNCQYRFGLTYIAPGQVFGNTASKLLITYEYEDNAANTRIKTVRIPINSNSTRLTNSLTQIGTNQIPALNTFLPESGIVYRDIFFDLWSNTAPASTANYRLGLALSGETVSYDAIHTGAAQSPYLYRYIWKRTDLNPNQVNGLYAQSDVTSRFSNLGGTLNVTYEYDHSASTTIMNSVLIGLGENAGFVPNGESRASYFPITRLIDEKNVSLKQSAFQVFLGSSSTATNFFLKTENQASNFYSTNAQASQAGQYVVTHRIDNDASAGAGLTSFQRGFNFINGFWWASNDLALCNAAGIIYLNYTSDKNPSGDGVHLHTVALNMLDTQRAAATTFSFATGLNFIETGNYFMAGNIMVLNTNVSTTAFAAEFSASSAGSEFNPNTAEVTIWSSLGNLAGERQPLVSFGIARDYFKRYPQDPDSNHFALELSRNWQYRTTTTGPFGAYAYLTYHANAYPFVGRVLGWESDPNIENGAGIPINIIRNYDKEKIIITETSAGGVFSGVYYNGAIQLFAEADFNAESQSATKTYVSDLFTLDNPGEIIIDLREPESVIISI